MYNITAYSISQSDLYLPSGQARVSGWGMLEEDGLEPDMLMAVNVTLRSDQECRQVYGDLAVMDSMICAGDTGKDACQVSFLSVCNGQFN